VIKTDDTRIEWEGRQYFEARELGFSREGGFIVSLFTTEPDEHRGGYFTVVPISPPAYRKKHPTKAAVYDNWHEIIVYCDWGRAHHLGASRYAIEQLLNEAADHKIPQLERPRS